MGPAAAYELRLVAFAVLMLALERLVKARHRASESFVERLARESFRRFRSEMCGFWTLAIF